MSDEPRPLPAKRARFVEEYLIDLNATQAAIRAGYSEKTAKSIGHELLTFPDVVDAIATAQAARSARTRITADRVLRELATLGLSNVEFFTVDEVGNITLAADAPKRAMRAVSSIKRKVRHDSEGGTEYETELKLWDKPGTLRIIAQHLGMLKDRVEHTGKDGAPIETKSQVQIYLPDNGRGDAPKKEDEGDE